MASLKAHRRRQLEERVRLAELYEDRGPIFASTVGTPVNPENLVKRSFKLDTLVAEYYARAWGEVLGAYVLTTMPFSTSEDHASFKAQSRSVPPR